MTSYVLSALPFSSWEKGCWQGGISGCLSPVNSGIHLQAPWPATLNCVFQLALVREGCYFSLHFILLFLNISERGSRGERGHVYWSFFEHLNTQHELGIKSLSPSLLLLHAWTNTHAYTHIIRCHCFFLHHTADFANPFWRHCFYIILWTLLTCAHGR